MGVVEMGKIPSDKTQEAIRQARQQAVPAPAVKDSLTAQPVAYAAFADNGNIQIWSADPVQAETLRQQYGHDLKPLYAAPQADQAVEAVAFAFVDRITGELRDFSLCEHSAGMVSLYTAPPAPDVSGLVEALGLLEVMQQQINGLLQYAGATDGYDEYAEQIAALSTHRSNSHE